MPVKLKPPPIYQKAHWQNTARVFPDTQEIGIGLTVDLENKTVFYKLNIGNAQLLADSLQSFITTFSDLSPTTINHELYIPPVPFIGRGGLVPGKDSKELSTKNHCI